MVGGVALALGVRFWTAKGICCVLSRDEAAVPSGCQPPKMGIALRLGRFMPKPTRLGLTQVITGGAQGVSAGYRRRTLVERSHIGAWETVPSGCPIGA